jgi:hypothetical protein
VQRADEIKAPGDINSQIINRLMDAELVIADMSMHNANAFYELAIRHMVRLPQSKLRRFGKFAASMQRERQLQTLRIVTIGHDDRLTDALTSDKAPSRS